MNMHSEWVHQILTNQKSDIIWSMTKNEFETSDLQRKKANNRK